MLPFPVTDQSTVYTSLVNFKSILSQLNQNYLAVACDEGVYRIARHIKLEREKEFENIILFLGGFHIIKVVQSCIGKYLKHSGIENVFIEAGLFGMFVVDQVLSGSNYSRSVQGFNFLAEALRRIQFKEFFTPERLQKYDQEIVTVLLLQESFFTDTTEECSHLFKELSKNCSTLISDFNEFVLTRCSESEMFKYWNNVLILISLMNNLIRADRSGDWLLHIETIEKLQPIFHVMDRTNYARWCAVYLHDMKNLSQTAPEVNKQFLKGRFTVKRSDVPGTSVATDQALEQTINRSSKDVSGIIGYTKKGECCCLESHSSRIFINNIIFKRNRLC